MPFVLELKNGTVIDVPTPLTLAFGGGVARYFSPRYELIDFDCQDVQAIGPIQFEGVSNHHSYALSRLNLRLAQTFLSLPTVNLIWTEQ